MPFSELILRSATHIFDEDIEILLLIGDNVRLKLVFSNLSDTLTHSLRRNFFKF